MDRFLACKILGVDENIGMKEIKRKYHKIISMVHPDSGEESDYGYTAQEVNEAYAYLEKHFSDVKNGPFHDGDATRGNLHKNVHKTAENSQNSRPIWNGPISEAAYCQRNIYEHVTDEDGEVIGTISIARGKYLWTADEEFLLFMKSLMACSKEILEECDRHRPDGEPPETTERFRAELVYLLAAEFMDPRSCLKELAGEPDEKGIFSIPAMLERSDSRKLQEGTFLYPAMLKAHRLYVKDAAGEVRGYLSFADDRLYYSLIPLFEQKAVQVRIVSGSNVRQGSKHYQKLYLYVRFSEAMAAYPENLNLRIEDLLSAYKREV